MYLYMHPKLLDCSTIQTMYHFQREKHAKMKRPEAKRGERSSLDRGFDLILPTAGRSSR